MATKWKIKKLRAGHKWRYSIYKGSKQVTYAMTSNAAKNIISKYKSGKLKIKW